MSVILTVFLWSTSLLSGNVAFSLPPRHIVGLCRRDASKPQLVAMMICFL